MQMQQAQNQTHPYVVAAFYRFVELKDYEAMKQPLLDVCNALGIKGTILLSREGINSTLSGTPEAVDALFAHFDADPRLANMPAKFHESQFLPFGKMKVRLKREIVRLGVDTLETMNACMAGTYVEPKDWDALMNDPDVITIDTRNAYETHYGTFKGAVDPKTDDFRSLPEWIAQHLNPAHHKKVAMYCTGGIRCEKSTALLLQMGFEQVYHLKGGILQYLADTGNKSGMWQGDCFVFDERIALNADLAPSESLTCIECNRTVSAEELPECNDRHGLHCPSCID